MKYYLAEQPASDTCVACCLWWGGVVGRLAAEGKGHRTSTAKPGRLHDNSSTSTST
jgi:hypothetical protein